MPPSIKQFLQQLTPFAILGVSITLVIGFFILFSYVLFWGILIGAVLWGANALIQYFKSPNTMPRNIKTTHNPKPPQGRIIDHEDN